MVGISRQHATDSQSRQRVNSGQLQRRELLVCPSKGPRHGLRFVAWRNARRIASVWQRGKKESAVEKSGTTTRCHSQVGVMELR